jgi:hypothetical protein
MKITRISILTAIFSCLINLTAAQLKPVNIPQDYWSQSANIERNFEEQRESWGEARICDLEKNDEGCGINFPNLGLTVGKGPSQHHVYVINHNNYVVEYLLQNGGEGWYLQNRAQPMEQHQVPIWNPPVITAWARRW